MQNEYSVNSAMQEGFECGVLYALRYYEESVKRNLSCDSAAAFANHLSHYKRWKTKDEWETFLLKTLRDREGG